MAKKNIIRIEALDNKSSDGKWEPYCECTDAAKASHIIESLSRNGYLVRIVK